MSSIIENLEAAEKCAVPIIGIETMDQQACVQHINENMKGQAMLTWDSMRGLRATNEYGGQILAYFNSMYRKEKFFSKPEKLLNPASMLEVIDKLCIPTEKDEAGEDRVVPEFENVQHLLIFMYNIHRNLDGQIGADVSQGISNVRNPFKNGYTTLVLLGPVVVPPDELTNDIMLFSEELPDEDQISEIIDSVSESVGMDIPEDKQKIISTLIGLPAFSAEQNFSTCLYRVDENTVDIDRKKLWERKCKTIEQIPGLSIWRGGETFDDIGGCDNVKNFLKKILNGKKAPNAIIFIDEIEKCLAGAQSDTSGVTQDQLGVILSYMQNNRIPGVIFIGPPGAAKSIMAQASGNEINVPTVEFDIGGTKDSLVGASGKKMRNALNVIKAISQGKMMFIATCNSIGNLPPELRRRFKYGTFFFDLPSAEDRKKIWPIHIKKEELTEDQCDGFDDDCNWTGAEISSCCELAGAMNCTTSEASKFVVPVAVSAKDQIDTLRREASGAYIDANKEGVYQYKELSSNKQKESGVGKRKTRI